MANPYLEGGFAPVREEVTLTDLDVTGQLPQHLDGRYLRIGPNPVFDPGDDYAWFLGDGMVHGLRLRDGEAQWYRNRYVRSPAVAGALGEKAPPGHLHAGMDFAPNTNVIGHAGRTFALVESGPSPYELTGELDTIGPCSFDGTLKGGYSAHPIADPVTGELHAISYFWGWGNRVQYSVVDTAGRVRRSVDLEVYGSPMMHSFSLTESYIVIYDLPAVFDKRVAARTAPLPVRPMARLSLNAVIGRNPIPERLATAMARGPAKRRFRTSSFPYRWDDAYPARIGVLPREGTSNEVRWFEVEPCYVFHPMNAYEDGDTIVLDVIRHPRVFDTVVTAPEEGPPTVDRWTIDLVAGRVSDARVDDHPQEFPRIDERLTGRRHRYGYSVGFSEWSDGDSLIRHDMVAGGTKVRPFGRGQSAAEFVFIPNGPDSAEDDGVLMGFVQDVPNGRTDLLVLDSQTLDDVAAVHLPVRVPAAFHGNWVPTG